MATFSFFSSFSFFCLLLVLFRFNHKANYGLSEPCAGCAPLARPPARREVPRGRQRRVRDRARVQGQVRARQGPSKKNCSLLRLNNQKKKKTSGRFFFQAQGKALSLARKTIEKRVFFYSGLKRLFVAFLQATRGAVNWKQHDARGRIRKKD